MSIGRQRGSDMTLEREAEVQRAASAAAMSKDQLIQLVLNLEENMMQAEEEILELKIERSQA